MSSSSNIMKVGLSVRNGERVDSKIWELRQAGPTHSVVAVVLDLVKGNPSSA